jgi:hypothetical protein
MLANRRPKKIRPMNIGEGGDPRVTNITDAPHKKRGRPRKARAGGGGPPEPPHKEPAPRWKTPAPFPPEAHALLHRSKISKKQFVRFVEELSVFLLKNLSGDFVISLQKAVRRGDRSSMEMFAKIAGLVKGDSPLVVNLQNNLSVSGPTTTDRSFDSVVRGFDDRDRRCLPGVIDVTPVN